MSNRIKSNEPTKAVNICVPVDLKNRLLLAHALERSQSDQPLTLNAFMVLLLERGLTVNK
jgi:hypothetical protein